MTIAIFSILAHPAPADLFNMYPHTPHPSGYVDPRTQGYYDKRGRFIYGKPPPDYKPPCSGSVSTKIKAPDQDAFADLSQLDDGLAKDDGSATYVQKREIHAAFADSDIAAASAGGAAASSSSAAPVPTAPTEDSLREPLTFLPPPPSDSEDEKPDEKKKERMDDLFASLMGEIGSIKTAKREKAEKKYSSPEDLIESILGLNGKRKARSAYEVLQLPPDVTDKELTKTYRTISRLIHPDKCKHENAHEAFQRVLESFNELKEAK